MKKVLVGLAASAALAAPLAVAGSAIAAPAPADKATGSVTWAYTPNNTTGTVVFSANDKTGGTLAYADSTGQTLNGVVTIGSVEKSGSTITFAGVLSNGQGFTAEVRDGGTSGSGVDQIGLFVERANDGVLAEVTGGNLTVH